MGNVILWAVLALVLWIIGKAALSRKKDKPDEDSTRELVQRALGYLWDKADQETRDKIGAEAIDALEKRLAQEARKHEKELEGLPLADKLRRLAELVPLPK
jgi:hypothetical protein